MSLVYRPVLGTRPVPIQSVNTRICKTEHGRRRLKGAPRAWIRGVVHRQGKCLMERLTTTFPGPIPPLAMNQTRPPAHDELPSSSTDVTPSATREAGVCRRDPPGVTRRRVNVVYTDVFLDTFNYSADWESLWEIASDTEGGATRAERLVLLVLSSRDYDTVSRNEDAVVLRNGRCFVTTPSSFGRLVGSNEPWPPRFDAILYFNVDPFLQSVRQGGSDSVVGTPFSTAFDHHMTDPRRVDDATITVALNTCLIRTETVEEYERSRRVRIDFKSLVVATHPYHREDVCRTVCNFCSDDVLCVQQLEVYTVRPDQQMPSLRSLGPAVAESLFRPDHLVLLDVSSDQGGPTTANAYFRLKQFYLSFAHGRDNKWGLTLAADVSLQTYLKRWNSLLREEMKRWFWILRREADSLPPNVRPTETDLRRNVMQVFAMCPCILNSVDLDCEVCTPPPSRGLVVASTTTRNAGQESTTNSDAYIRDVLMSRYDTSSFLPGGDLDDRTTRLSLLARSVSISNELVVTSTWPGSVLKIEHNRFFASLVT